MNKGLSLFLSVIIAISIFIIFNLSQNNLEEVIVSEAIDGDTIKLEDGRVIRLVNINTPEKGEFGYSDALNFTKQLENKKVELEIKGTEKYGRLLGEVYYQGYFNLEIIEEGYGSIFLVEENQISKFVKAQEKSYLTNEGIWKKSDEFGCLEVSIDKKEEYVDIYNLCNIKLYLTLKDETTNTYDFAISPSSKVIVHSEEGIDNETDKYWSRGNAWNDDRDSIFIRDKEGLLVYYDSYGY